MITEINVNCFNTTIQLKIDNEELSYRLGLKDGVPLVLRGNEALDLIHAELLDWKLTISEYDLEIIKLIMIYQSNMHQELFETLLDENPDKDESIIRVEMRRKSPLILKLIK